MKLTIFAPIVLEIPDLGVLPAADYSRLLDGDAHDATVETSGLVESALALGTLRLVGLPTMRVDGRRVLRLPLDWFADGDESFAWSDAHLAGAMRAENVAGYLEALEPADLDAEDDDCPDNDCPDNEETA